MKKEKEESDQEKNNKNQNEPIFFNESYQLRHNKDKLFVELLLELLNYEKRKEKPKINFEDEKCFKYVETVIILLFYYVFNLNKDNKKYAVECNYDRCNSSSSESDSEEENGEETMSSEEGEQLFEQIFLSNKQEEREYEKGNEKGKEKGSEIENKNESENENEKRSEIKSEKENIVSLNNSPLEGKRETEKNFKNEKNKECKKLCEIFFSQQPLHYHNITSTIKQKHKVEINILNIYYTAFYSNIIDTLLNSAQVEICDIILFFLFDNVGTINQISTFFSEGFYTLDKIYLYVSNTKEKTRVGEEKVKHKGDRKLKTTESSIPIDLKDILKEKMISGLNLFQNEEKILSQIKDITISNNFLVTEKYELKLNKPYKLLQKFTDVLNVQLEKRKHFQFCLNIFFSKNLKLSYLEASKPWIFYWAIHTIHIMYNDYEIEKKISKNTFNYIKKCVFLYLNKIKNKKSDSFGGGLNQFTHIATTYAAICVFVYLHDNEHNFLSYIDRKKLHSYILQLKCPDGSFRLHKNGEIDLRGTYCAIVVCSLCHILTKKVKKNVEKYILSCQNYEGGFSSEKLQECHGGYTYCALATLCILGKVNKVNINSLTNWLINKQSNLEGSLMGRTNKLVDSCYSFWIGACYFLINIMKKLICSLNLLKHKKEISEISTSELQLDPQKKKQMNKSVFCNLQHLKLYLLCCSQNKKGGMRDKPFTKVDYYHTCYAISGLSLIENYLSTHKEDSLINAKIYDHELDIFTADNSEKLNKIHILYNINIQQVYKSYHFFSPDFPLHGNKVNYKIGKGAYMYLKGFCDFE